MSPPMGILDADNAEGKEARPLKKKEQTWSVQEAPKPAAAGGFSALEVGL